MGIEQTVKMLGSDDAKKLAAACSSAGMDVSRREDGTYFVLTTPNQSGYRGSFSFSPNFVALRGDVRSMNENNIFSRGYTYTSDGKLASEEPLCSADDVIGSVYTSTFGNDVAYNLLP